MYQHFVGQASIETEFNCCKSRRDNLVLANIG